MTNELSATDRIALMLGQLLIKTEAQADEINALRAAQERRDDNQSAKRT